MTGAADAYDYLLMKIDGDGRELWRRVIAGDANDPNHGVVLAPDGRIVFVGYTRSWGSRDHDVSVIHFTAGGEPVRHQIIGGPGDDRAQFAARARDGSVWITGYTKSFGGGDWDVMLVKVDASGTVEPWMGAVGSAADDNGSAILAAGNGDLLITGYSSAPSNGAAPPDAFVMRVKPGTILRHTEGVSVREGPLS